MGRSFSWWAFAPIGQRRADAVSRNIGDGSTHGTIAAVLFHRAQKPTTRRVLGWLYCHRDDAGLTFWEAPQFLALAMTRLDDSGSWEPCVTPHVRLHAANRVLLKRFDKGALSVASFRRDLPDFGPTTANPPTDVHMVVVRLSAMGAHDIWRNGQHIPSPGLGRGSLAIYDLRQSWVADLHYPFHTMNFFVPQQALDEAARELRVGRIDLRSDLPIVNALDPVMMHLAFAFQPVLDRPEEANRLFVDHVARAIVVHLASTYARLRPPAVAHRGGLAPWQVRRAKEMLIADRQGALGLSDLAAACQLSVSHFARAFKRSTGAPPHRWLLEQRVEEVKSLLLGTNHSVGAIAKQCGFADQSHLVRVFARMVGTTPGAWRHVQAEATTPAEE